ncbi:MAG: DNA primase [Clostridia bacterium]|nr:DNA primase [Clostridia bacterium]
MPRLPQTFIDELADRLDIVDVISDYVTLKGSGRSGFVGLCPFHREKTPSFSVSADKQLYYCFGCHESGNVFSFIMKIENLSFYDSVVLLAERAGMEVPQSDNEQRGISKEKKQKLLDANRNAARFYHQMLYTPEGNEALSYLRDRGLSDAHIKRFGLGFAPNSYNALTSVLHDKGFTNSELIEVGLSVISDRGARDFFRNRIMFPIINIYGDVIAFGGRVMDKSEPKYLNTGDTPVFNKRKNLYGINIIKKNSSKKAILCEGYMDVIALNINGFDYGVASLGTALTRDQIKLVNRFCKELYVSYDGDRAGIAATHKAIDITREEKIKVKVIQLEGGRDPDEYMRQLGVQAYSDAMNSSVWGIEYLINEELSGNCDTDEEKAKAAYNASQLALKHSFDSIELEMHLRRISTKTGYSLESLYRNVGKTPTKEAESLTKTNIMPQQVKKQHNNFDSSEYAERMMLKLICENQGLCEAAESEELVQYFDDGFRKELLELLLEAYKGKQHLTVQDITMMYIEDPQKSKELGAIFIDDTEFVQPGVYFNQTLLTMKKDKLILKREALKQKMDQYIRQEIYLEDEELKELLKNISETDLKINKIRIDT